MIAPKAARKAVKSQVMTMTGAEADVPKAKAAIKLSTVATTLILAVVIQKLRMEPEMAVAAKAGAMRAVTAT